MASLIAPDHEEEQGSPEEQSGENSFTATRRFNCAWNDRHALLNYFLFPPGELYPYWTATQSRAISGSATPYPGNRVVRVGEGGLRNTKADYNKALVTINYSSRHERELFSETIEPTAELLKHPPDMFRWGPSSAGGIMVMPREMLTEDEAPGRLVKTLDYVVTRYAVPAIPAAVLTLIGCCNGRPVRSRLLGVTFAAERLLFSPPQLQRKITTAGTDGWTMTFRFSFQPTGWNTYWRAKTQTYEQIYVRGSNTPFKQYPLGNFAPVLP